MKSPLLETSALIILLLVAIAGPSAAKQKPTYNVLYTFSGGVDGSAPSALAADGNGNFYGLTESGGDLACNAPFGCGVVFEVDAIGKETVRWAFTGGGDGFASFPYLNGVLPDKNGNVYGGSLHGSSGHGLVFKVDPSGQFDVLYNFTGGADGYGYAVISTPILDQDGNLYGTTDMGGYTGGSCSPTGCGVVFKLDPSGNETVLHTFTGNPDGSTPYGGLVRDTAGNLYGTTWYSNGLVFKLDPQGNKTVLHTFTAPSDGTHPIATLIRDKRGNLYGVTQYGGNLSCQVSGIPGCGVVFKLNPNGKETVLHRFSGNRDGGIPYGSLVQDKAGNLYGTTLFGGNTAPCPGGGCGVLFKLDPRGHETVLYDFCSQANCADGANPYSESLVLVEQPSAIVLYGTAPSGGNQGGVCSPNGGCGVVFQLTVPK